MTKKVRTMLFMFVFLGAMFGGLFHMTMGMDMSGTMSDCMFMASSEKVCSMGALEHAEAWKSVFLSTVPSLTLLLTVLATTFVLLTVAPHLLIRRRFTSIRIPRNLVEQTYLFSHRPLQELFSDGILHPKLF